MSIRIHLVCISVLLYLSINTYAAGECTADGECSAPTESTTVYIPVGELSVRQIQQPPRLSTLNGKRIAIVGGSFMASVTHPELKALILRHYPDAEVYLLNEIGSAGPWPGPGVTRRQKDIFVQNLKRLRIDAVISGNGGCGLCTQKEVGSCIAAEYAGIPTVMITAPGFSEEAGRIAMLAGVPVLRIAEYPGAFSAHSREELLENTKKVLWPQIIKALTTQITGEESAAAENNMPKGEIPYSGNLNDLNRYFVQNGWSDGLPVIPPTRERVDEFLRFTDIAPDEVIAVIPPGNRRATVRLIAINGVMSGCPPEYMPILIAFTKAMADGNFRRTLTSTHAWTPFCWLNGPLARQLGFDSAQGEISNPRNAVLGRFINLALLNLGDYHIKQNRMGTFGYLMPWCLVEDDTAAITLNWLPYHMQQGYMLNDNVLTVSSALTWGNNLSPATTNPQKIMELMAWDAVEKQQFALGSGTPFVFRTMLITGSVARNLAAEYKTKDALEAALIATARRPLAERAYANYWGNPGSSFNPATYSIRRHISRISRQEHAQNSTVPPWLEWTGIDNIDTVPVMQRGKTALLISGDVNRNKTMCIAGGGFVSIKIELPRNWDQLMEEYGYQPLSSFYLNSSLKPAAVPQQFRIYR